ncbi:MAG: TolC family protein, partial [Candidatus Eisenbacteria bacterium]
ARLRSGRRSVLLLPLFHSFRSRAPSPQTSGRLGPRRAALALALCTLGSFPDPAAAAAPGAPESGVRAEITLIEAIRLTLAANPRLQALGWEIRKAEGRTRQAAVRPNPTMGFDFENFGGTDSEAPGSEATLSIGQILELGGKRSSRIATARSEQQVVSVDLEAGRLDLMGETASRYLQALATERALELSELEVKAAEEAVSTTSLRVTAGASHPVERRRAEVELANVKLEQAVLRADAEVARSRLSSMWGEPEPRFLRLLGAMEDPPAPPPLDSLTARIQSSPLLRRWVAERSAREQRLKLEHARSRPDLNAQVGLRRFQETSGSALIAGVSLPLPIFDRNRGAIDEAAAALAQVPHSESAARVEMRLALAESHVALRSARSKLDALRRDVLPGAERALEEMRVGFDRGRFTYLDFLEARRTWLRARHEELQTLLQANLALAQIERLLGTPINPSSNPEGGRE